MLFSLIVSVKESFGGLSGLLEGSEFDEEGSQGIGGGGLLVIVPLGGTGGGFLLPAGGLFNIIAPGAIVVGNTEAEGEDAEIDIVLIFAWGGKEK